MNHHVLLVDDDFANLRLLTQLLEPLNVEISLAASVQPALALLQTDNFDYDLILLERSLPGCDGLGLLRLLKRDPRFANIPVIMQTASAGPEQVTQGLEAGAAYYVTKPIQPDLLVALVRSALSEATDRRSIQPRERTTSPLLNTLRDGKFRYRTLAEARAIACELSGLCPEPERVALGLTELMVNAIEHGNLEISYAEKSALCRANSWHVEVERRLALPQYTARAAHVHVHRGPHSVEFSIRDEGRGFRWRDFLEPDPSRAFAPNGRGIALARELAFARLEYKDPGNLVVAEVALGNDE
jgi:CheY-like chemotaxis protein